MTIENLTLVAILAGNFGSIAAAFFGIVPPPAVVATFVFVALAFGGAALWKIEDHLEKGEAR